MKNKFYYSLWAALLDNPAYDEPKIQRNVLSIKLYMPSPVSYGNAAQCQQSNSHDSSDDSGDLKTTRGPQALTVTWVSETLHPSC